MNCYNNTPKFRLCSRTFKVILPRLEQELFNGIVTKSNKSVKSPGNSVAKDLEALKSIYSISGFPLNFPFTDLHAAVEAVYNTDVHSTLSSVNGDDELEFGIAVYCHGYPG
ncbi:Coiled-coil and C2 domain-containing protein 2A, partial [Nowakowskiella sp. JEL0078]